MPAVMVRGFLAVLDPLSDATICIEDSNVVESRISPYCNDFRR